MTATPTTWLVDQLHASIAAIIDQITAHSPLILVACSGGNDSSALALLLAQSRYPASALLYVDHATGDRARHRREEAAVRELAARCSARFYVSRVPDGEIERDAPSSGGFEAAAREHRYRRLIQLAASAWHDTADRNDFDGVLIVTAHHRDDQLETAALRLVQGHLPPDAMTIPRVRRLAAPDGATGLPPLHAVRPALSLSRQDLQAVVIAAGIAPAHDETNDSARFERNRVRAALLPALEAVRPGGSNALLRFVGRAGELAEAIAALIPAAAWGVRDGNGWLIPIVSLARLPVRAQELILRRAWHEIAHGIRVPHGVVDEALRHLQRAAGNHETWRIESTAGLMESDGEQIRVGPAVVRPVQSGYLEPLRGYVRLHVDPRPHAVPATTEEELWWVDVGAAAVLRSKAAGDRIVVRGRERPVKALSLNPVHGVIESPEGIVAVWSPGETGTQLLIRDGTTVSRRPHTVRDEQIDVWIAVQDKDAIENAG